MAEQALVLVDLTEQPFNDAPQRGQKVIVSSTLLPHFGQYDIQIHPDYHFISFEYLKHALNSLKRKIYVLNTPFSNGEKQFV